MMGHWQRHEGECLGAVANQTQTLEGLCWFLWGSCSSWGGSVLCRQRPGHQPPSLCSLQAQPFTGGLPAQQTLPITGEKQHQVLRNVLDNLTNVMNGYCLPEPYFSTKVGAGGRGGPGVLPRCLVFATMARQAAPAGMGSTSSCSPQVKEWVAQLMKTLRDPSLPLLELQEIMTSISGRIPLSVEKSIRKVMAQYASNITSVLCCFPSQQVSLAFPSFLARAGQEFLAEFVLPGDFIQI